MLRSTSIAFATILLLASCTAALVPQVDDPARKLRIAQDLFENRDRPLAAEPLIVEAISIYEQKHDVAGVVEGQRIYGLFLRSQAVGRSKQHYMQYGFKDKDVSFGTRLSGALLYFKRATTLAKENKLVDILPNLYLNIGLTNLVQGNRSEGCAAFDESLRAEEERIRRNPSEKIILPPEYASFREGVNDLKAKAKCSS